MSTAAVQPQAPAATAPAGATHDLHVRVAVIGSGFTGLAAVHELRKIGMDEFVVLERADDVGGTWRENSYPGIACDVPSHLYSLSFAPNPDWARTFSSGEQIWQYTRKVARDLRMDEKTRFGEEVLDASWDAEAQHWSITTTTLKLSAEVIVDGSGVLTDPTFPAIAGLESFKGKLFHSARWDHTHDLAGERVAVIGTGASAVQIVPAIAPKVARLTVFQRTAAWVLPRNDRNVTPLEQRVLRAVPALTRAIRGWQYVFRDAGLLKIMHNRRVRRIVEALSSSYLRRTIDDRALREKLTPTFELGCKRILITSEWYPALNRPNVEVETSGISEVREHSIVTEDGTERELDAIVCATGFHVSDPPIAQVIHGRDGRSLAEMWGDSPRAYRGVTSAGFPNLFRIGGIGTGTGHMSQIMQIESGMAYVIDALRVMDARRLASVEVTEDAQDAYHRRVRAMLGDTVWVTGGCKSWYLDPSGEASALWPSSARLYRRWTQHFDVQAYRAVQRARTPAATVA